MTAVKLHLFSKTTILLVEDNSALRIVLKKTLIDEGYEVLEADNGLKGYEIALAEHPDLILLDMMLPEMDGVSVLRELRKDEWGANAKVLVSSNLSEGATLKAQFEEYKIAGFIEKVNLTLKEISKKIEEVLTKTVVKP